MSKVILVMDMPESCLDCDVYNVDQDFCQLAHRFFKCFGSNIEKPDWCPLKPMPEKINHGIVETDWRVGYVDGYNECIDKILEGNLDKTDF